MPGRLESFFLRKTSTARLQLDALDGLRGIAVLIVVLSHLSNADLFLLPGLDFRGTGKYGVYLFFVLSAYLLTKPLLRDEVSLADARGWARYALRRVLRIFPLYYLVLVASWYFTVHSPTLAFPSLQTADLVRHLALQEGVGHYWTIPVEFSYYLVLPFVALAYRALRLDLLRVFLATGLAIVGTLLLWPPEASEKGTLNLGFYLPIFLLGSFAAVADVHWQRSGRTDDRRRAARAIAAVGALGVVALFPAVMSLTTGETVAKDAMHRQFLAFGVLWAAVVFGTVNGGAWLERALATRPLRLVGVVSFSIYLWHVPVARGLLLTEMTNPWGAAWAVVTATIAAGMLSFALVEWPFTRAAWVERTMDRIAGRGGVEREET